jgi:hypothetical protein
VSIATKARSPCTNGTSTASRVVPGRSDTITRSLPDQSIHERRLARVALADDRELEPLDLRLRLLLGQVRSDGAEQIGDAETLLRADRKRIAEAEPRPLGDGQLVGVALDLVDAEQDGPPALARRAPQALRDELVPGNEPFLAVDDEHHDVRRPERHVDLALDVLLEQGLVDETEPPMSTSSNARPSSRSTRTLIRSRVTPAVGSTIDTRRPAIRFSRLLLPTFGGRRSRRWTDGRARGPRSGRRRGDRSAPPGGEFRRPGSAGRTGHL